MSLSAAFFSAATSGLLVTARCTASERSVYAVGCCTFGRSSITLPSVSIMATIQANWTINK